MEIKAVIFDLDGVICHTDHLHFLAWREMAIRHGLTFDECVNDCLRGVSRMESLNILLGDRSNDFSLQNKEELAAEKNAIYRSYLMKMTPADVPTEVTATLAALHTAGIKLAIGSSSKNARLILERVGLLSSFDAVADGTQITHSKPDPEVFLLAAELLQVAPKQALVVEDAVAGIQAAKNGGFWAAAIGSAACANADICITSLKELLLFCGVDIDATKAHTAAG